MTEDTAPERTPDVTEALWKEYCDASKSTGELPGGVEEFDIDEMNCRAWDLYEHSKSLQAKLDAARKVKPLVWDGHPDGEGFYAFPNDAGSALYVLDLLPSGRWRLFIGGDLVMDPDDPERVMKWGNSDDAKAYAQVDLDGRLRRILSALDQGGAE